MTHVPGAWLFDLLRIDVVGRRRLRDIDSRVDTDPDAGRPDRCGVVDAVPLKPYGVISGLQRLDDQLFVGRRDTGKQRCPLHGIGQLVIAHCLDLLPEEHMIRILSPCP